MRLSAKTLARLSPGAGRFVYDRASQRTGIVHLGVGAFHRAHQAWYTDRAMDAGDRDWAILAVSLRSEQVARQMNPQDGLYSVTERGASGEAARVVGAVRGVLIAATNETAVVEALAAASTHIVTLTVTEKGYCRAENGDLDPYLAARSFYPLVARAFERRRAAGLSGLTLLSCDNLAGNGTQLERLLTCYLAGTAPHVADWFAAECACPSTMADRIVPATTPADRAAVAARLGMNDEAAVVTESFSQWVIEDRFAGPRPRWERVGAQLVSEVAPYESAKLRMLNGAHSAIAYFGLERGHAYVHQAMADPQLRSTVEILMRGEAATSLRPAPGQDLSAYADALLIRFANPALPHRLDQIATDGSQKIPQRWLETVADQRKAGRSCPTILRALAAWLRHVRGDERPVDDPLAHRLAHLWCATGRTGIVDALFGEAGLFSPGLSSNDRAEVTALL